MWVATEHLFFSWYFLEFSKFTVEQEIETKMLKATGEEKHWKFSLIKSIVLS